MTDMTLDDAVKWLRAHVGDLRSAARVLRESPWGAKMAATAAEVDKAADEGTLAIAALEAAQAERDAMREALKDADNELDWLDEDVDTCDHSVGVCMCSYWSMRRKMKAALSKGNSND